MAKDRSKTLVSIVLEIHAKFDDLAGSDRESSIEGQAYIWSTFMSC